MSVNIHILISIVILFFAETVGLWVVYNQLTIPPDRVSAALWVYQFSILMLMVNMLSVPYNAMIIAHERMNVFAWVSIIEVILKLLIVFMLQWFGFDKLKLYAILMFGVALFIRIIYGIYCNNNFKESKFRYYWDKSLFKTLINYAGWNLWGNAAGVIMGQGVNILLNIFFGPVVNAARGIAFQVQGAINQFVINFQMAMNPQIIKSYAAGDLKYMHQLIFQGAKYSFFLLYVLSLPIIIETEAILKLWLKIVPMYTVIFTRLVIINILVDSVSGPLMVAAQASGKIKLYQSVVGGILILNLPFSYLFLKLGFSPELTMYVSIGISILCLFIRLVILEKIVNIDVYGFIKSVIVKSIIVGLLSVLAPLGIYMHMDASLDRLIIVGLVSIVITIGMVIIVGLNKIERMYLKEVILKVVNTLPKHKKI